VIDVCARAHELATRLCRKQEADRGLERFMSKRSRLIGQIGALCRDRLWSAERIEFFTSAPQTS
jgi:hypothetical protein